MSTTNHLAKNQNAKIHGTQKFAAVVRDEDPESHSPSVEFIQRFALRAPKLSNVALSFCAPQRIFVRILYPRGWCSSLFLSSVVRYSEHARATTTDFWGSFVAVRRYNHQKFLQLLCFELRNDCSSSTHRGEHTIANIHIFGSHGCNCHDTPIYGFSEHFGCSLAKNFSFPKICSHRCNLICIIKIVSFSLFNCNMSSSGSPAKKKGAAKKDEPKTPSKVPAAKKGSPVSAFKQGGSKLFIKAKDDSQLLYVTGVKGGIVSIFIQKHNAESGAYMTPFYSRLQREEAYRGDLDINALMPRRSSDGTALISGGYVWEQMICLVGNDVAEDPAMRKAIADKIMRAVNHKDVQREFQWPRTVKFGGDLTSDPLGAADTILVDKNCMEIMQLSYPEQSSAELAEFEEIISDFFTDAAEERVEWVRLYDSGNT